MDFRRCVSGFFLLLVCGSGCATVETYPSKWPPLPGLHERNCEKVSGRYANHGSSTKDEATGRSAFPETLASVLLNKFKSATMHPSLANEVILHVIDEKVLEVTISGPLRPGMSYGTVFLEFRKNLEVACENGHIVVRQEGVEVVDSPNLTAIWGSTLSLYALDNQLIVERDKSDAYVLCCLIPSGGRSVNWYRYENLNLEGITASDLVFGRAIEAYTGIEFACLRGGTFEMGDFWGDGNSDERPLHSVTVSDFCIGEYEVTQNQWGKVMGSNPSRFSGCPECPVDSVSWDEIQVFLERLKMETGKKYRLPTEAEWEYAARSGGALHRWSGASSRELIDYAWFLGNSRNIPNPVGKKRPNILSLYDMSGNVWEWCQDWYDLYPKDAQYNPAGPPSGKYRVARGGSWDVGSSEIRTTIRKRVEPYSVRDYVGFREAYSP